jgi:hypothetical protein
LYFGVEVTKLSTSKQDISLSRILQGDPFSKSINQNRGKRGRASAEGRRKSGGEAGKRRKGSERE